MHESQTLEYDFILVMPHLLCALACTDSESKSEQTHKLETSHLFFLIAILVFTWFATVEGTRRKNRLGGLPEEILSVRLETN